MIKKSCCCLALSTSLALSLTACQSLFPKAQGLQSTAWLAQSYQRQDQVEVQWKEHSFSFLLYQQQQGKTLQMVALSLTGQQLFQLTFDGKKIDVQQRIQQMKLLPFDFLVRDVLFATYPHFAQQKQASVGIQMDTQTKQQQILIQQKKVLVIQSEADHISLENLQVPYQMIFSAVTDTLESNE